MRFIDDVLTATLPNIGLERVKNADTTASVVGNAVILDATDLTGRAVKMTTTADNPLVIGIWREVVDAGKFGDIAVRGSVKVNAKTGVTPIVVGDLLSTTTTAGKVTKATPVTGGVIAIAQEAVAATTEKQITAFVWKA